MNSFDVVEKHKVKFMQIKKVLGKITWLRNTKKFLYYFVHEFLSNRVVSYMPSAKCRLLFWKSLKGLSFADGVYIQMGTYIYSNSKQIVIGENTIVNRECVLDGRSGLFIGKNVNISPKVEIYSMGHDVNSPSFEAKGESVYIEDYVWLGTRCMIMPGVSIGKGAFVMPGAIVTKNVSPYAIVAGIPARQIGRRSKDLSYELNWRLPFS